MSASEAQTAAEHAHAQRMHSAYTRRMHSPGSEENQCRVGRSEGGVDAVTERMLRLEAPGSGSGGQVQEQEQGQWLGQGQMGVGKWSGLGLG